MLSILGIKFIDWRIGVLTNLALEHIEDYGSFEKYRDAKNRFLKGVLKKGGRIFLNGDDGPSGFFVDEFGVKNVEVFSKRDLDKRGILGSNSYLLETDFNKENLAGCLAVAGALGVETGLMKDFIFSFRGISGRMEFLQWEPFWGGGGLCSYF